MVRTLKIEKKIRSVFNSNISKPPILQRQLFLWLVMTAIAFSIMLLDVRVGLSLLWGFSVCMLPAVSFTWYAYKNQDALVALVTVNNFYRAEAFKIALTALLFALVFKREDKIDTVILFIAYIAALICSSALVAMTLHKRAH